MCHPAVAAAASVVQGIQAQNAAVDAANRQNQFWRQNLQNSYTAFTDENRALNARLSQENDAKNQSSFEVMLDFLQRQGRAQTAAGEAGVSGNSVRMLYNQLSRAQTKDQNTLNRNFKNTADQLNLQKNATVNTWQSRVNSVQKGYAPSAGDALLGTAMNAGLAYAQAGGFDKTPKPTGLPSGTGNGATVYNSTQQMAPSSSWQPSWMRPPPASRIPTNTGSALR